MLKKIVSYVLFYAAISVFFLVGYPSRFAYAEGKSAMICNYTSEKIYISVGWTDWGFPVASGWYGYEPRECSRIIVPKADTMLPIFGYGIGESSGKYFRPVNSMKNHFCINRSSAFTEKSTTLCQLADETAKEIISDWELFNALGNPIAEAYTWNIY
ncbi:MAG: DUF1036 domain-containing protein [Geminicoccaceae bacterium]